MDKKSFEEYESLCNVVFGGAGGGNINEARERLEAITLHPSFVEKAETIFNNSKNTYALHVAGTSLTKVMTDYWNNYDIEQKLRIRNFVLEYVIKHGCDLPEYISSVLCKLICRITALSWMSDTRQRDILEQMRNYSQSQEHCLLAFRILEELVNQINPTKRSSLQENKAAIDFQKTYLKSIIQLDVKMLSTNYASGNQNSGIMNLQNDLYAASLKLLVRCLSFDSKNSNVEEGIDDHPLISLPMDFLTDIFNAGFITLLMDIYQSAPYAIATSILEVLLWMLCIPRGEMSAIGADTGLFNVILVFILSILESGKGIDEFECIHMFCQVLERVKYIVSSRQLITYEVFDKLIPLVSNFTTTLLSQWMEYQNTIPFILRFWALTASDFSRMNVEVFASYYETTMNTIYTILKKYISVHLEGVGTFIENPEDDPLSNTDIMYNELCSVRDLIRLQYESGCRIVADLYDSEYKEYSNQNRLYSTMKLTGNQDTSVLFAKRLSECKLSWLILIMGYCVKGQSFTSMQIERGDELWDAEFCKRVFALNHSISYRMSNMNNNSYDMRLELALLSFFSMFRDVYSVAAPATSDVLNSLTMLSGMKQACFCRFYDKLGLGDCAALMNIIVDHICNMLKFWGQQTTIVEASLDLFLEMSKGYSGCKMLLQLESVEFMLQNHTEETFTFLTYPQHLSLRHRYYASLTKLVLMDNVPGRMELFILPIVSTLKHLDECQQFNTQQSILIIKTFSDLRGIITSCQDKRSYNILFDAINGSVFSVMKKSLSSLSQDESVTITVLKCLYALVDNREPRVDNGSNSTNGIILFKNTSSIITSFGTTLLQSNIALDNATDYVYRVIRILIEIMNRSLTGKYVPFGVFSLYQDDCLSSSLEVVLMLVLKIPFYQIDKRQKLQKACFSYIDILFTNHMETLSSMDIACFISLVQFVVAGIDSYDKETVDTCADCVDQLATYYYLNKRRGIPAIQRLNAIVDANKTLWNDLFEKILNSLLFNKKTGDILSRPIHSIYLVDNAVLEHYYGAVASTQPPDVVEKLKASLIGLMNDVDVSLEPILRDKFCEKCRLFREEVLGYLVL